MLSSGVIDLAVGLTIAFGIVTVLASVGTELIARLLGLRGVYLLRGLRALLDGDGAETDLTTAQSDYDALSVLVRQGQIGDATAGAVALRRQSVTATAALFGGPIFRSRGIAGKTSSPDAARQPARHIDRLARWLGAWRQRWREYRNRPTYIPADSFADAILDLLVRDVADQTTTDLIRYNVDLLPDSMSMLRASLQALLKSAGRDICLFRALIEDWYDDHMDRVSGWYKRHVAKITFIVGGILVLLLNINTLTIGRALYNGSIIRATTNAVMLKGSACRAGSNLPKCLADLRTQAAAEGRLNFPIGWATVPDCAAPGTRCNWLDQRGIFSRHGGSGGQVMLVVLGFLPTLMLLVPGARFWFDLFSKIARRRKPRKRVPCRAARGVHVVLADQFGRQLPPTAALAPVDAYLVRVAIGPRADETPALNLASLPVHDLTPTSSRGWWFDVVAASTDVDITTSAHRVFLHFDGSSWACPCTGTEHTCSRQDRRPYLDIAFRTRTQTGQASLRCTVYHRNNAIQSTRVAFTVGADPESAALIHGVVDYSLADDLGLVGALPPRRLNVLTNESAGGTHSIVVKGEGVHPIAVDLTEAAVSGVLRSIRQQLTLITLGRDSETTQYDADNSAPVEQLTEDLRTLASFGSQFWQKSVPETEDQALLRPLLSTTATIQIARVTSTVFPWAIVYDYPYKLGAPWEPCELLQRWPESQSAIATYPDACPFASRHSRLNTLCPFGFWGFRHLIEQPPPVKRGKLRTTLPVPGGAHAATVRSLNLDGHVTASHLQHLRDYLAPRFTLTDCESLDDFLAAIDTPALPLIYFYCHGRIATLGDSGVDLPVPYLEIGHDEMLGTTDLNAWAASGQWHRERWLDVPPLVFINGCKTAALSPEQVVTFVDAFAGARAAGVIGTEIAVAQPLASDFAQHFFRHLMADSAVTVGQALRRSRLDFLAKGNIAGLVYTAFCSMDLMLEPQERAIVLVGSGDEQPGQM
jgi:hypothetical protein